MAKLNIRPLNDKIVVKRVEAEEKTKGGIVLPDTAKEKPQRGKVTAVGSGKLLDSGKRVKPDVEVGDLVLFGKYAGSDVQIKNEEFKIVRESEILGRIEE